jgi:hypothetical protein
MSTETIPGNGTPKLAPKPPETAGGPSMQDELLAMIKATVAKVGNTKKSKGAKRAYLRFVKAAQDFAPEDRDTAIDDLRRLMDKAGTDGDNDVALQAARTYVGTGLVG